MTEQNNQKGFFKKEDSKKEQKHFLDDIKLENPSIHSNYNLIQKRLTITEEISDYMTMQSLSELIGETDAHTRYLVCKDENTKLFTLSKILLIETKNALDFVARYNKEKEDKDREKIEKELKAEKEKIEKEKEREKKFLEAEKKRIEREKEREKKMIEAQQKRIEAEKKRAENEKLRKEKLIEKEKARLEKLKELTEKYPENEEFQKLYEQALKNKIAS